MSDQGPGTRSSPGVCGGGREGAGGGAGDAGEGARAPHSGLVHSGLRNTKKLTGSDFISNIKKVSLRNFLLLKYLRTYSGIFKT